ncbi:ParB/RepB/Spo0J family partition protein [Arthrobacter sp. ISL-72]|uniref:ParB/RepB/Spo0J family partition protein n=1 Tax=Arthrobacter sp. ISL-72 TaxID=2819114 RepID=UPI001BE8F4D9|nr:ParB/RepB/Spo0J family partition protein [Arthrobacter sp. ISL-72]MBT2596418.1 ParB-like nuclease domain-containing protein [Arthrobacter sp. ISL-72]
MPVVSLSIAELAQDPIDRSRPYLDPERVSYYVDHLDDSTPVVVFDIDGALLLADGYHRVEAAKQLGRTTIAAEVRQGQRSDALQFAIDMAQRQQAPTKNQIFDAIAQRGQRPEEHT